MDIYISPNRDIEKAFWMFAHLRQEAWYNRHIIGDSHGWTHDTTIATTRFTNTYRALDRGTQYLVERILERDNFLNETDRMLHVLAYRFFNRIETYQGIRPALSNLLAGPEYSPLVDVELCKLTMARQSLYTGAYTASHCPDMGRGDAIGNALAILEVIAEKASGVAAIVGGNGSIRDIYNAVRLVRGFGPMIAYMVAVDLTMPLARLNGDRITKGANPDQWALISSAATSTLKMMGIVGTEPTQLRALKDLQKRQRLAFDDMGLDFKFIRRYDGAEVVMSIADIVQLLGEFKKYLNIASGAKPGKNIYKCASTGWTPQNVTLPAWGEWNDLTVTSG